MLTRNERRLCNEVRHAARNWRKQVKRNVDSRQRITRRQDEQYQRAHGHLVQLCEELTKPLSSKASATRSQAGELVSLLKPWSSCKAIQMAPYAIVKNLVAQQRSLENQIVQVNRSSSTSQALLCSVLLPVFGIMLWMAIALGYSNLTLAPKPVLDSASYSVAETIQRISNDQWLVVAVLVPWALGVLILWTTCRR